MMKIYWWANKNGNSNKADFTANQVLLIHWLNKGGNFKLDIIEDDEQFIFKKNTKYFINEYGDIGVNSCDCRELIKGGDEDEGNWYFTKYNFLNSLVFTKLTDKEFEAYDD